MPYIKRKNYVPGLWPISNYSTGRQKRDGGRTRRLRRRIRRKFGCRNVMDATRFQHNTHNKRAIGPLFLTELKKKKKKLKTDPKMSRTPCMPGEVRNGIDIILFSFT